MRFNFHSCETILEKSFLKILSYGLIMSGLAMIIAGNTRPASGSEHLISHAIDEYLPEKSTYHGIQVAYGSLLVTKYYRKGLFNNLEEFFSNIGMMKMINKNLVLNKDEIDFIIKKSLSIRQRFTILNLNYNVDEKQ